MIRNIRKLKPEQRYFILRLAVSIVDEPEYFPTFKVREILYERSANMITDQVFTSNQTAAGATHPFFDDDLPEVHEPFLPPIDPDGHQYTLVLDLDETLVHYFDVSPVSNLTNYSLVQIAIS